MAGVPANAQSRFGNDVVIEQDGTDNTATIDQTGSNNLGGTESNPILQSGYWNEIRIDQAGSANRVGTDTRRVVQRGLETTPLVHNSMTLTQTGTRNLVGAVTQIARGAVPQGTNTLLITQTGRDNTVAGIVQDQQPSEVAQRAEITMDGAGNIVRLVHQEAGSDFGGDPNRVVLTLAGNDNGRVNLSGVALVPGLRNSAIVQTGRALDPASNGNEVELFVLADDFRFGSRQGGRMNRIGPITVSGAGNALGIRQEGLENDMTAAALEGIQNVIGVDQYGTNGLALNIFGDSDFNIVSVDQMGTNDAALTIEGDTNEITARQDCNFGEAGDSILTMGLAGDNNYFDVVQEGENNLIVSLTGSDNNSRGQSGAFATLGLRAGQLVQSGTTSSGSDNTATITVVADSNAVATRQIGGLNSVLVLIQGDDNELGILQGGSANAAAVHQVGHSNPALVRQ